ncbi:transglycosylase SLT domain-containing protein [Mycolicibacillus parakoreensis]|uniref:Transglycosylase SLT domain-containing protein n=1 Tax=Mycolicibacillus parakoreensis TaxID=1069221 RepID=A0ABY3TYZ3_9MYCO|nr:transglycosylase SLT domain-containing protein [Mycolicibacillus parakoreensis]MCV7314227.1 transglycosylase SLT domain-containing protein [Mycolicibacillus parakoreensis]ULN52942.1 transglycosylase SLT domain-containing protein [Mycolicibacillus parakoreensis]HLR99555.1 transglycosylase SLT domain-containing protein [Mycolicibacillus parakoreensis]
MSADPLAHAVALLTRGHRLYGGPGSSEPTAWIPPAPAAPGPGAGDPAHRRRAAVAALAAVARDADRDLQTLLRDADTEHRGGYHHTRAVLDAARSDPMPAADTPLGRREALRRMAARLRAQHRHIGRSRRRAHRLARRLQRLRYPGRARREDPGRLDRQIAAALDRLHIVDPAARRRWLRGYRTLIARESSGSPTAVAARPASAPGPVQADGHPLGYARGLTQTLPATFARYHQPGTATTIYDPVANICASMNYVMGRYGVRPDATNLAALVQQADPARPPKGY